MRENKLTQKNPMIVCYLKTYCGWSAGVRKVLKSRGLEFADKDVVKNPAFLWEMNQKCRDAFEASEAEAQDAARTPCVIINGEVLVGVSGDELSIYLDSLTQNE